MLINGSQACWGFSFILSGKLRVYRLNEEGREVTLYRLEKGDSCFMTVICALAKSQTYAYVKVEEDCELAIIPMPIFEKYLMNHPTYLQFLFQKMCIRDRIYMMSIMMSLILVGCSGESKTTSTSDTDQLQIVTTLFPQYDFARQIAGDKAEVTLLLPRCV